MPKTSVYFAVLLLLLSAGCSSIVPAIYKLNIRQGNYIDQSMVSQLRVGMSKRQVQFLMGTPLINDPFHEQRWDYFYSFRPRGGEETTRRHIILYFEGETLARIEGELPPEGES